VYKLSHLDGRACVEHRHLPCYASPDPKADVARLAAGVPDGDARVFERLVASLREPYFLLYVLHTPRGEGAPGRYQSPELTLAEVRAFLERFRSFFAGDARFDLWAHSPAEQATVVWERHDLVFAYGPLERFAVELRGLGFRPGTVAVPFPHKHHYRAECDAEAKAVLEAFEWSVSPLEPEDEQ